MIRMNSKGGDIKHSTLRWNISSYLRGSIERTCSKDDIGISPLTNKVRRHRLYTNEKKESKMIKEYSIQHKPFNDWMSTSSPGLGYQTLSKAKNKAILLKQQTGLIYRIVEREINDMGLTSKSTVIIEYI